MKIESCPGSNSYVFFDYEIPEGEMDISGSRKRPPNIALAHELQHGWISANDGNDKTKLHFYYNFDERTHKRGSQ